LRFDFTHFSAMTPEEIKSVEDQVNEKILESIAVDIREMSIDEARKMAQQHCLAKNTEML